MYPQARKRYGQHFLHDPAIIRRMVAAIEPRAGERLLEIGPGLGALTLPLLDAVGQLEAVEIDRDLADRLEDLARGHGELRLYRADALRFNLDELGADTELRIVGNLPYNISTPLLFHLLSANARIRDLHLMLQREVVERMQAPAGTRAYGRLSVMTQYRCRTETLFTIGKGAFRPAPKVESAFIRLIPLREPPVRVRDESRFQALVRQAFGQRRKTLRNALRGLLEEDEIRAAGIDPGVRPERLTLTDFARLSNAGGSGGGSERV